MKIPKKIVDLLSFFGVKIVWKPTIYEKNIFIIPSSETSKIIQHLAELPLMVDEERIQGYVREDLGEIETSSLFPPERFRAIVREMREYLPLEYYSALLQACNVIKLEDLHKDKVANRVLYSLRRRTPIGAKMYNLLKTSFFIVEIYPRFQSIVKKGGKNKDAIRGKFTLYLDKMLDHFRYAVWVTRKDSWQRVKERIKIRRKSVRVIAVYARGKDSIEILDKAVNSLIAEDPTVNAKLEVFTEIRGVKAKNVLVGEPELIESLRQEYRVGEEKRLSQS